MHVCAAGSRWERRHLLFRDYLRANTKARAAYAEVKFVASRLWRGRQDGLQRSKDAGDPRHHGEGGDLGCPQPLIALLAVGWYR